MRVTSQILRWCGIWIAIWLNNQIPCKRVDYRLDGSREPGTTKTTLHAQLDEDRWLADEGTTRD
jgi:hypothetical protein